MKIGVDLECTVKIIKRLVASVQSKEGATAICISLGKIGFNREGLVEVCKCLVKSLQRKEHATATSVRF
jgi:hypothetical protein